MGCPNTANLSLVVTYAPLEGTDRPRGRVGLAGFTLCLTTDRQRRKTSLDEHES